MNRRQLIRGLSIPAAAMSARQLGAPALPFAPDRQLDALISPVFEDVTVRSSPGFAVSVLQGGETVFARGYGMSNLDDETAITTSTVFHLASLSKQFTGAAIALLVLAGALDLDTSLAEYFPEAAKYGADLTLAHLVYMTSGLHEYTETARLSGQPWQSFFYFTRDEAIARSLAQPALEFAPGSKWAYSNVNYMILSRVVELVSGQNFSEFVQERILTPLGMSSSFIDDDTTRVVRSRAIGYGRRSAELQANAARLGLTVRDGPGFARLNRVSPHFGGSGVFSSLDDLARWNRNWSSQIVGGSGFTALMTTTRRFSHDKVNDGLGLVMGAFEGRLMIWYAGADLDTSTWIGRFPEKDTTLVCLSNFASDSAERRIATLLPILARRSLL